MRDEELEHYGTPGMKWGRRKDKSPSQVKPRGAIKRGATKAKVATDAGSKVLVKGETKRIILPREKQAQAEKNTQQRVLLAAAGVNRDARFKGKDLKTNPELKKAYFKEMEKKATTIYKEEILKARLSYASETITAFTNNDQSRVTLSKDGPKHRADKVRHADEDDSEVLLVLSYKKDELGQVTDVSIADKTLAQGENFVESYLEHYGTPGMKWGVRKDKGHEGERAKTKKIAKLDKKFDKDANQFSTLIKVHNRAAQLTNDKDIDRINNKPEYAKLDFTRESPLREKYYKEHQDAFLDNARQAAKEFGTNASGTKRLAIVEAPGGERWDVFSQEIEHADGPEDRAEFSIKVTLDSRGKITRLDVDEDSFEHSEKSDDDVLVHYGVPGMKWGVRRNLAERKAAAGSSTVTTKTTPKGGIKTVGGKGVPVSDDAKKAAVSKQIARKSTTNALSNQELQALVTRMNLEQQYSRLKAGDPTADRGQKFMDTLTGKKLDKGTKINPADEAIANYLADVSKKKSNV